MILEIHGTDLPGLRCGTHRGEAFERVHVGIQRAKEVVAIEPADAAQVRWDVDVDASRDEDGFDFRGPYVQGRRGGRFVYLSWGTVDTDGRFEMFRRAKLMLGAIPGDVMERALDAGGGLVARLGLTGGDGGPLCASVRPPVVHWSARS